MSKNLYTYPAIIKKIGTGGGGGPAPSNMMTTDTNQDVTATKTFKAANGTIRMDPGNGNAGFMTFERAGSRKGYIGFESGGNNHIKLKAESGNLLLSASANVETDRPVILGSTLRARQEVELGNRLRMGHGGTDVKFTPEDNSTKILKFGENSGNRNKRFDLDLEGQSIIKNCNEINSAGELKLKTVNYVSLENKKIVRVASPEAPDHAATKAYVDDTKLPYGAAPNQAGKWIQGEVKMGFTFGGKQVYSAMVGVGTLGTDSQVDSSGIFKTLEAGNFFLGVGYGVITRVSGGIIQLHNMNAVTNAPDQHASIIWYNMSNRQIEWYFNSSMTLTNFHRRPFVAQIFYTKNS